MDALSQALVAVRFTGATFFRMHCSAPWGFRVPNAEVLTEILPNDPIILHYHLVTDGHAEVRLDDGSVINVAAGEVIVFPRGDGHTVTNGEPEQIVDSRAPLQEILSGRPSVIEMGGGGAPTNIICGFFACRRQAEQLFLDGLHSPFKVAIRSSPSGAWLESSMAYLASEAEAARPGTAALLAKTAEALFVQMLRQHGAALPDDGVGWLAAAMDPIVGRALALLHHEPSRKWTNEDLATAAHTSTSVLSERFTRFLEASPSTYLTRWRLNSAAAELETSNKTVVQIAAEVGYESEASFNRAFKRAFGLPPRQYAKRYA